jgi:RNAse (barnase) inhibitor barstar
MSTITIDCSEINSESAFWQRYLIATKPEGAQHFGCNLDAFRDALGGGPGWPGEICIRLTNSEHLKSWREGLFYKGLEAIAQKSKQVAVLLE